MKFVDTQGLSSFQRMANRIACILMLSAGMSGCQQPATVSELKQVVESSAFGKVEHFKITKGSMKDVRARLGEFAERCLSKDMISVRCGINCVESKYATYSARFDARKDGLRFVLQRKDHKGFELTKLPAEGMYIMVAEAESGKGGLSGHIWGAKMGYGDMIGSTRGWMTGEDKKCPDIQ